MSIERQIRRLQQRHTEEDALARATGLKHLLSTADGRRFVWLFLADCGVNRNPFSNNALSTSFNCGELNVGQKLLAEITVADPDAFLVMQKENVSVERSRTADANRVADGDGIADD